MTLIETRNYHPKCRQILMPSTPRIGNLLNTLNRDAYTSWRFVGLGIIEADPDLINDTKGIS